MTEWKLSDDDLKRLIDLNSIVFDLEVQIKSKLVLIRATLLEWLEKKEISEFKLDAVFEFRLKEKDAVFSISLDVDRFYMPKESELDITHLASGNNYNPYFNLSNHPLRGMECCLALARALLLVDVEKRKMLCACKEVIATTSIELDQRGYAAAFDKEKYTSVRLEFIQE